MNRFLFALAAFGLIAMSASADDEAPAATPGGSKAAAMVVQKTPVPTPAPIPDDRIIRKTVKIRASIDKVWRLWTTSDGVSEFLVPATVELKVGGKYEYRFVPDAPEGQRGSEGCTVLAWQEPTMFAFSWNAPPSLPSIRDGAHKTIVVVTLTKLGTDWTQVSLVQHDLLTGDDWDAYYRYFDSAWAGVLGHMKSHLEKDLPAEPAMKWWVYYIHPKDLAMLNNMNEEQKAIFKGHSEYIRDLAASGRMLIAGPSFDPAIYPSGDKVLPLEMKPPGVIVFQAPDEAAAKAIMEGDPAVREGLFMARLNPFVPAYLHPTTVR